MINFEKKISINRMVNIILTIVLIEIIIFGCLYLFRIAPAHILSSYIRSATSRPQYLYSIYAGGGVDLNRPSSTTIFNDKIYIADTNNGRIAVYNYDGKYETQFGLKGYGKLKYPVSICFAQGKAFVADTGTRKIHVFDQKGNFLGYFGDKAVLEPNSVFYKDEKFFVLDNQKMKVTILNSAGRVITSFGKKGMNVGEFYFPYSVYVSDDNKIYVADSNNNRIQVFDLNGRFLNVLTGQDTFGDSRYSVPRGTAFDRDGNLYISEGVINSVSVTDKNGKVLLRFSDAGPVDSNGLQDKLYLPTSVFIDENQRLYVTEFGKSRVIVYKI